MLNRVEAGEAKHCTQHHAAGGAGKGRAEDDGNVQEGDLQTHGFDVAEGGEGHHQDDGGKNAECGKGTGAVGGT